jgi:hypothetical protein
MFRVISSRVVCHDFGQAYDNFSDGSNWVPFPMEGICCVSISPDGVIEFGT